MAIGVRLGERTSLLVLIGMVLKRQPNIKGRCLFSNLSLFNYGLSCPNRLEDKVCPVFFCCIKGTGMLFKEKYFIARTGATLYLQKVRGIKIEKSLKDSSVDTSEGGKKYTANKNSLFL